MSKRRAAFLTLGCKVNQYETDAMEEILEKAGYEIVSFKETADVYIINTCSVTNMADRKSRQMIHRAKKNNPDAIIVAAGCYVQAAEEELAKKNEADILVGNNKKKDIAQILEEYFAAKEPEQEVPVVSEVIDINHTKEYEDLTIHKVNEHTRAYIKIQDGCNQFCSYCIIPYTRGRIRSKNPEEVIEEVKNLAAQGYKEIVLTGIHLSSYGKDLGTVTLLDVIKRIQQVEDVERIRLGSLEPRIITEEFMEGISSLPKVCPHFHLSLQSGCDKTLRNMNRRYSAAEYAEKCELIRKFYPSPALTTDVIVGFPVETEEDFEESYEFVKNIHFYETHIFKYSRRQGTKAAVMEGQLTEAVKSIRSEKMIALHEIRAKEYETSMIGKTLELLLEEEVEINGKTYFMAHSKEYVRAVIEKTKDHKVNDLVRAKAVDFADEHVLLAICEELY